jgi:hypothetical protein
VLIGLYAGDSSTFNTYRNGINTSVTNICSGGTDLGPVSSISWKSACDKRSSAQTEGSLAWAFGGAAVGLAVVGVILVMTDSSKEGPPAPAAGKLQVLPTFGPNGGGLSALLTF